MNWPAAFRDISVFVAIGAVVGLLLGLPLDALDIVDSPFIVMAFGIVGGSAASMSRYKHWEH